MYTVHVGTHIHCICVLVYNTRLLLSFLRAKHPVKVHVWGSINLIGRTGLCIFEGKMDAKMYIEILRNTLKPFLDEVHISRLPSIHAG